MRRSRWRWEEMKKPSESQSLHRTACHLLLRNRRETMKEGTIPNYQSFHWWTFVNTHVSERPLSLSLRVIYYFVRRFVFLPPCVFLSTLSISISNVLFLSFSEDFPPTRKQGNGKFHIFPSLQADSFLSRFPRVYFDLLSRPEMTRTIFLRWNRKTKDRGFFLLIFRFSSIWSAV